MSIPAYPPRRRLDLRHGTHNPVAQTPDRLPGSVRRTTTIDMIRPLGDRWNLTLIGRGRDISTARDGSVDIIDEAAMEVVVDYLEAATVAQLTTTPVIDGLEDLIGRAAGPGFRAAADAAIGEQAVQGRAIYQLLDDIPVATLVSGYAVGYAEDHDSAVPTIRPGHRPDGLAELQVADLCAGFQAGGTIMMARAEGARSGPHVTGPFAPPIERSDDPWAWHDCAPLPADGMRRRRRIDVRRLTRDSTHIEVDAYFRDSHMGADGYETIIHEYVVRATVDGTTNTFLAAEATPHVLPWYECPQAAVSAGRLVGQSVETLRPDVRAQFVGPATCTHLNDTFRALADVPRLALRLPE
jgi:Protein of unknown function (DUF2889)